MNGKAPNLLSGSVEVDANLIDIRIGPGADDQGTHVTLILPHIRGVSGMHHSRSSWAGDFFNVWMHNTDKPISIYGGYYYGDVGREATTKRLALVRHEILAAVNAYYHRPVSGEQLKLKL